MRKRMAVQFLIVVAGVSGPLAAGAAAYYWDSNGSTTGAGATPNGTWGVNNYWNTASDGTGTPGAWVDNNYAVFSAGTDATGAAIVVQGSKTIKDLKIEEGSYTFSGASSPQLRFANGSGDDADLTVAAGASVLFGASLPVKFVNSGFEAWTINGAARFDGTVTTESGNTQVSKYGAATLTLGNTFNVGGSQIDLYAGDVLITGAGQVTGGQLRLKGGNLLLGTDTAFGGSANSVQWANSSSRIKSADSTPRTMNWPVSIGNNISPTFEGGALTFGSTVTLGGGSGDWYVNTPTTLNGAVGGSATQVRKRGTGTLTIGNTFNFGGSQFDLYAGDVLITGAGQITGGDTRLYSGNLVLGNNTSFTSGRTVGWENTVSTIKTVDATARELPAGVYVTVNPTFNSPGDLVVKGSYYKPVGPAVSQITVNGPGKITLAGSVGGFANLNKYGTGTLVVAGSASVNNDSRVYAGTLLVNGSWTTTSRLDVDSGTAVGGSGTIDLGSGQGVNNWGTLTPGSGSGSTNGTLTVADNLTMKNGSTYIHELNDLVDVKGTLDLDNNWTLQLTGPGFSRGGQVTLFKYGTLASSPDLIPSFTFSNLGFTPGTLTMVNDTANKQIVLLGIKKAPPAGTVLSLR